MINEELKTFIAKMRAVGKTDLEITAELKTAGWAEADINQELSSKTSKAGFNFGKMKFWIWLYGIAILLPIADIILSPIYSSVDDIVSAFIMTYILGIVPILTLLALGFKLLFWILRFIPHFKDSKPLKQLDHKWLLVISTAITGTIMLRVGYLGARSSNLGMGSLVFFLLAILGGLVLIISFVVAIILIIVKHFLKNVSKNRLIWILLISVTTFVVSVVVVILVLNVILFVKRSNPNSQPTTSSLNEAAGIKLSAKTTKSLEISQVVEKMPMIFIGEDNHLSRLRFDQTQQRYLVEKKIDLDLWGSVQTDSLGIYVPGEGKMVKYSSDLKLINQWQSKANRIKDYYVYKSHVYVLVENSLIILDESLREISKLPLEIEKGFTKDAHDIIIDSYNNIAYLLDNQVRPIYILKIDVLDVKKPKILSIIKINDETPNLDLYYQWLDIENLKWIIYGGYGNRVGSGTKVYSLPMNVRGNSSISSIGYGLKVFSTTKSVPAWGLVDNGGQTCLTKLGTINKNRLEVDTCYQFPGLSSILGEDERYLLIKTMTDKREGLLVIDKSIEEKLVIVAEIKDIAVQTADLINIP